MRMHEVPRLLTIALCLGIMLAGTSACEASGGKGAITFAVLDTCRRPICDFRETDALTELHGGIMKDWYGALAAELGRQPRMLLLSRRRMEDSEEEKRFDLDCFLAPQWVAHPERYDWLPPFLTQEDRLLSLPAVPPVHSLNELAGKRIGYVLGYVYPALEPLFSSGQAIREIAPNEESQIYKQLHGRSDYAVMNMVRLDYLRAVDPGVAKLVVSPLVIERVQQTCRRTRHSRIPLADLNAAQQRLLARGALQQILERYRPPHEGH